MKKEIINNYYTDEDLINFKKLNNFKEFKLNKADNSQINKHSIKYSMSDSSNFKKIINIKDNEKSTSKNTHEAKEHVYYNSSDIQNFDKMKQFTNFNFDKDSKTQIKNSNTSTSYTSDDVSKFNKIIKTENKNINNPKSDNKKIKVIDFDKISEKEKRIKNKVGIEKIKIVYFD